MVPAKIYLARRKIRQIIQTYRFFEQGMADLCDAAHLSKPFYCGLAASSAKTRETTAVINAAMIGFIQNSFKHKNAGTLFIFFYVTALLRACKSLGSDWNTTPGMGCLPVCSRP